MTIRRREFLITTGLGALGTTLGTTPGSGAVVQSTNFQLTVRGGFVLLMGQQVDLVTIKKPDTPCEWMQHQMLLDTSGLTVTKAGTVNQTTLPPTSGFPSLTCWDFTKANVTLSGVGGNTVKAAPEKQPTCRPSDWDNLLYVADLAILSGGGTLHPQWQTKVESRLTIPSAAHKIAPPPNELAKNGSWEFSADKKWPSSDNSQFTMPLTGSKLTVNVKYENGATGTLTLEADSGQPPLIGATLMAGDIRPPKCFTPGEKIKHFAMYYELLTNPPKCENRLVPVYRPCDGYTPPRCEGHATPGDYCPPGRINK